MKLILENTDRIVQVNGTPARVWEGTTADGIPVYALITRIAVHQDHDMGEFQRELLEQPAPRPDTSSQVFPARMVL